MSLFKSRDWWEVNLNENAAFDSKSLLPITLEKDEFQRILTGSHEGFLRLHSPSSKFVDGTVFSGYEASHLSMEVQFSSPILQIGEGLLVSGSRQNQLAVLHPRLFSVYALLRKKENEEGTNVGDQVTLKLFYQHVLRHSAHSFVLGFFGGVRERHFVCIQSLDGLLSFYEQESFAFQICLPDFLLPYPFAYLGKIDSFLFLDGYLSMVCYSYESLASSPAGADQKKASKTWEYPLGEEITDVQTLVKDGLVIAVLTDRNLHGFNENGILVFTKRFDYTPVAFCCYLTEERKLMAAIATDGRYVNLYEETILRWSMKIGRVPVCLRRVFLNQLPGGLALLSEDGFLQCVYVGTRPSLYFAPPLPEEEIDPVKGESELKDLQRKIASHESADPSNAGVVQVEARILKGVSNREDVRTCDVLVEVEPKSFLKRLQVSICVESPLVSTNPSGLFTNSATRTVFESGIYLGGPGIPSSLTIRVVVTYITNGGDCGCVERTLDVPIALVATESPPTKEARHRLTIATSKPSPGITRLFEEFAAEEEAVPNAIGMKFLNSEHSVTILEAKSSQRYRIQSDFLPALTLPLFALAGRLEKQFEKESGFRMTYSAALPAEDYCEVIRAHQGLLAERKAHEERLSKETSQYRTIQKKILTDLKDATPKSSSNFHGLLTETSKMIESTLSQLEDLEEKAVLSRCSMRSLNRLMSGLLKMMNVSENDSNLIRNLFSPFVCDADDQGWLEIQEATSTFFLRRVLNKSTKDHQGRHAEICLEPVKDASKLCKHLMQVVDRIIKGEHRLKRKPDLDGKESQSDQNAEETFFDDVIPAGTRFAHAKEKEKTETEEKEEESMKIEEEQIRQSVEGEEPEAKTHQKPTPSPAEAKTQQQPSPTPPKEKIDVETTKLEMNQTRLGDGDGDDDDDDDDVDDAIWDVKIDEMRF